MDDGIADGDDIDALIGPVEISSAGNTGTFKIAFVPSGPYTAAFSCSDDEATDVPFQFLPDAGTPVTVQNNLISTVNFTVPAT